MAFTNSAQVDNILLRGLNFRYPNNSPVSTAFTLYANGNGQTYWATALAGANLSTISTSMAADYSTLSTYISFTNSTNVVQSSNISTLARATTSSFSSLQNSVAYLDNSVTILSNQFVIASNLTVIGFANINGNFSTTVGLAVIEATAQVSNLAPVYISISTVQKELISTSAGLQSTIYLSNTILSNVLTSTFSYALTSSITSTTGSLTTSFAILSNSVNPLLTYPQFSSLITTQLISSSSGLQSDLTLLSNSALNRLSTISTYTNLTFISSTNSLGNQISSLSTPVSSLLGLSTSLYSTISSYVWPYVASTLISTTSSLQSSIRTNTRNISTLSGNLSSVTNNLSSLSSFVSSFYSTTTSEISTLNFAFSLLTTSSILVEIWSSFYNLEQYTSTVIGQRYSSIDSFESSLYVSTYAVVESTAYSYFNFYVSTMYQSTLSTLIPSTFAYMSTITSTLYSTGNAYMFSSLNSSMSNIQSTYTSTSYGLYSTIQISNTLALNSSLISYTNQTNTLILNTSNQATSLFNGITQSNIANQNQWNTFYLGATGSNTVLYNSNIALYGLSLSTIVGLTNTNSTFLTSTNATFNAQLVSQQSSFNSSIISYTSSLTYYSASSYSVVVNSTVAQTNYQVSTLTAQTNQTYSAFVSSLNTQISSIGLSTLYTANNLALRGTTYTQTLTFGAFTNFYVSISSILPSPVSSYRLTYDRNSIAGLNYRRGVISIDVNTFGQPYTNNGGQLRFDLNTLGVPTTVWKNVLPYISSSDYLAQYEYTIMNNTIWTNLLGLYPRVRVLNFSALTPLSTVFVNGSYDPSTILRTGSLVLNWTNYLGIPYSQIGQLPFEPQIVIESYINNTLISEYFPSSFAISTLTIQPPYLVGSNYPSPLQNVTLNMYIVGYQSQAVSTTYRLLQPTVDRITIENFGKRIPGGPYNFVGGYEMVLQTDSRSYPAFNALTNYPNVYFNNNPGLYTITNLTSNMVNRAGFFGSPRYNQTITYPYSLFGTPLAFNNFTELTSNRGYNDFLFNIPNYQDLIAINLLGGTITFTLRGSITNVTFVATNLAAIVSSFTSNAFVSTYTLVEAWNPNIAKTNNAFVTNRDPVTITYSMNLPPAVSTVTFTPRDGNPVIINENPFVGGSNAGTPDTAVTGTLSNLNLTSIVDPVSSIVFYNLISTPLVSSQTAGTSITCTTIIGNIPYTYSFSTSGAAGAQVFSF